jgi:hypothetical protein
VKLFCKGKDGGPESTVTGYWLIEWKRGFSIALFRFDGDSREAFHTHAFNAVSWLLSGMLYEKEMNGTASIYLPNTLPIVTPRDTFHKVSSKGTSWVLTFRGPWTQKWNEYLPLEDRYRTLASGRVEVDN